VIIQLTYLLHLAQERHFGRAAAVSGVAQPTLSAGIKQLEDTLGVPLVRRGSRFLGLTREGEVVLTWARRIVSDDRAMREEVRALRLGVTGHIRLAAVPTALAAVARLTTPFAVSHPAVTLSILSRSSDEILTGLDDLQFDLGLTYLDAESVGRSRRLPLYRERYCAITPAQGPLADRADLAWSDLAGVPLCLLTEDMQNRRIIGRKLRVAGIEPAPVLESNSLLALLAHVHHGLWTAVVPLSIAGILDQTGHACTLPIRDPQGGPVIGLIYPARDPLTPALTAFIQAASDLIPSLDSAER
jgi:DNA-binding transcriptional LysR family regulator